MAETKKEDYNPRKDSANWINNINPSMMKFGIERHYPERTGEDGKVLPEKTFKVAQLSFKDKDGAQTYVDVNEKDVLARRAKAKDGSEKSDRTTSYRIYMQPSREEFGMRRLPLDSEKDADGRYTKEAIDKFPEGMVISDNGKVAFGKIDRASLKEQVEADSARILDYLKERSAQQAKERAASAEKVATPKSAPDIPIVEESEEKDAQMEL